MTAAIIFGIVCIVALAGAWWLMHRERRNL